MEEKLPVQDLRLTRVRTLEELVDAAAVLSTQPLPRGRRVAVITNAGGLGIIETSSGEVDQCLAEIARMITNRMNVLVRL